MSSLKIEAKRFVAIHECLHTVLYHPFKMKGFDHDLYNFIADGKVNHGNIKCEGFRSRL